MPKSGENHFRKPRFFGLPDLKKTLLCHFLKLEKAVLGQTKHKSRQNYLKVPQNRSFRVPRHQEATFWIDFLRVLFDPFLALSEQMTK